jgi:hypothetical protein
MSIANFSPGRLNPPRSSYTNTSLRKQYEDEFPPELDACRFANLQYWQSFRLGGGE